MKGHIRKRGKSSWEIIVELGRDLHGKRQQKFHTVRGTKRDAQRELNKILSEIDNDDYVEPHKLTVAQFLEQWLVHIEPRVRAKTYHRYQEIVRRHLVLAIGGLLLRNLGSSHIEDMHAHAMKEGRLDGTGGLSKRTVRHHHRVLRDALNWAVSHRPRLLSNNPTNEMKHPKADDPEIRALSDAETVALLRTAESTRLYLPIMLAVTTGLRRSELLALRWQDVDGTTLRVRRTVEQSRRGVCFNPPKTKKGKRSIALPSVTVEALRRHRIEQKELRLLLGPDYEDSGLVVCQPNGRLWLPDNFTAAYRRLVRSTDLGDVNFHCLRHTHATQLLRQGVNPKIVSERLGHSSVTITLDIYSHVLPGMQEEAADKVDAALRAALDESA